MRATILHESRGRMRLRLSQKSLSLRQADLLEAWLKSQPWVKEAVVHERTRCIILYYLGNRSQVLSSIGAFTWEEAENTVALPAHTTRALNRQFQEKLVGKVLWKGFSTLFLPTPVSISIAVCHMIPFLRRGLRCLIRRKMKVELLDAISIGISACRRDFGTAGTVMFLLELGELLEEWTRKKSVADLADSLSLHVDRVWMKTDCGEVLTPISQVHPGDLVVVRAGSVIPLDGVVAEGEVMVNQASLTGESVPVEKRSGGAVYSGTVVEEGECIFEVSHASGHGRYDQIVEMIQRSEQMKSVAEAKASNLADRLVPYTFIGSLLSLALTRSAVRALSVLMVDFSCALKLAMPLAVLSAMREAGKEHITVKGGKFLEAVAKADTIIFDKTGTLTHACPKVAQIVTFGGNNEDELLRLAACLEEHFPHSMANAVVAEASRRGPTHEEYHSKVEYLVAHGIASSIDGKQVRIGSAHFIFEDEHVQIPNGEREKFNNLPTEFSHLYMAIDGILSAVICISDPLREEAGDVISALRALGIKNTVMLTGDSPHTASAIASQLDVDDFRAGILPAGKAEYVSSLRREGHTVLMVGDGINDSPALSEADAGIAISDGAAIAREIADITIAADSLWELVRLRQLSMALMKRIDRNYRFVIGFNGALIALGVAGVISPATSAMLHNFSTLGVSLQSMSSLPAPRHTKEPDRLL